MIVDLHVSTGRDGVYEYDESRETAHYGVIWCGERVFYVEIDKRLAAPHRELLLKELTAWWQRANRLALANAGVPVEDEPARILKLV
jgi:hypothetical protein